MGGSTATRASSTCRSRRRSISTSRSSRGRSHDLGAADDCCDGDCDLDLDPDPDPNLGLELDDLDLLRGRRRVRIRSCRARSRRRGRRDRASQRPRSRRAALLRRVHERRRAEGLPRQGETGPRHARLLRLPDALQPGHERNRQGSQPDRPAARQGLLGDHGQLRPEGHAAHGRREPAGLPVQPPGRGEEPSRGLAVPHRRRGERARIGRGARLPLPLGRAHRAVRPPGGRVRAHARGAHLALPVWRRVSRARAEAVLGGGERRARGHQLRPRAAQMLPVRPREPPLPRLRDELRPGWRARFLPRPGGGAHRSLAAGMEAQEDRGMNELLRRLLFLPDQASTFALEVDQLHYFVILTTFVMSTAVGLTTILFFILYRRRSESQTTPYIQPGLLMETAFVVIPLSFFLLWWVMGYRTYVEQTTPPQDAMDVYVMGKKWMWKFAYPGGPNSVNVLHVPAGRPVRLLMTSRDVIHSFYVPEFRIKQDVLPGRYTETWFEAVQPGRYQILCAEYCGAGHSVMRGEVIVLKPEEYEDWLAVQHRGLAERQDSSPTGLDFAPALGNLVDQGRRIASAQCCLKCHTIDGTRHI